MFERFTPRARAAMTHAQEQARSLGHGFVGTEHLLLGVLLEPEGVGARALVQLGANADEVKREIEHRIGPGSDEAPSRAPFTPRSKKTLEMALREAKRLGHDHIGTEHLVLGLLRVSDGVAAEILSDLYRLDHARVRDEIVSILTAGGWRPQKRRSRPFVRPAMQWTMPSDPSAAARRRRVMTDVQAVLDENERMRQRLRDHRIDPDSEAGEQPA